MESRGNRLGNIHFTFSNIDDWILIKAISNECAYEKGLASNCFFSFHEIQESLQNNNFTIVSQTS